MCELVNFKYFFLSRMYPFATVWYYFDFLNELSLNEKLPSEVTTLILQWRIR